MIYYPTQIELVSITGGTAKITGINGTGAPDVTAKYRRWRKSRNAMQKLSRNKNR